MQAARVGVRTQLSNLLLRDGLSPASLNVFADLTFMIQEQSILRESVASINRAIDFILCDAIHSALLSMNIAQVLLDTVV